MRQIKQPDVALGYVISISLFVNEQTFSYLQDLKIESVGSSDFDK